MLKSSKGAGWFSRQARRIPFFAQCMLTYIMVMLAAFSAVYSVSLRARNIARQSYLAERQYALNTSAESLNRQIVNFRAIPYSMQKISYYMQIRLLERDALRNRHYYSLNVLRENFTLQSGLLEIENVSFVYFQRNGALVNNTLFSLNAEAFFESALRFQGYSGRDIETWLKNFAPGQAFLPSGRVYGTAAEDADYLAFIYRRQDESAVYCMLLKESAIEQLFRMDELPDKTTLKLTNDAGDTLYEYWPGPAADEECEILKREVAGQRLIVELGIPSAYFSELAQPLDTLTRNYIFAAVAAGVLMSLLFSLANLMPLKRLLRLTSPDINKGNEFYALGRSIRRSIDENALLRAQMANNRALLRFNLIARLLAQDGITRADEAMAVEHLPQLKLGCRVLCLRVTPRGDSDEGDYIGFHAREKAVELFPSGELCVQMRRDLLALMMPGDDQTLALSLAAAQALSAELREYGTLLAAGVSESFTAPEKLHAAYMHAQFCLRHVEDSQTLSEFVPGDAESEETFKLIDLSRYQSALIDGDEDAAQAMLDSLLEAASRLRWVHGAVRFLLDTVCEDMNITRFVARGASLKAYAASVASALAQKRAHHTDTIAKQVLDYLNANYADASLSTDSVAAHFGISKSYLYRALKESAGMSQVEKLEMIRMQNANRLLKTTQMSVAAIADACGYHSANTFYKAYKKLYGRSPNAARGVD